MTHVHEELVSHERRRDGATVLNAQRAVPCPTAAGTHTHAHPDSMSEAARPVGVGDAGASRPRSRLRPRVCCSTRGGGGLTSRRAPAVVHVLAARAEGGRLKLKCGIVTPEVARGYEATLLWLRAECAARAPWLHGGGGGDGARRGQPPPSRPGQRTSGVRARAGR